jgi:acyl-CoA thioesterase-2
MKNWQEIMSSALASLLESLHLEETKSDTFLGTCPAFGWQRIFGGLVVSQAATAIARTALDRDLHSLHGYFLLPGNPSEAIRYEVTRLHDGRSFSNRLCHAIQGERLIFSMTGSLQRCETGFEHSKTMPHVPAPEELQNLADLAKEWNSSISAGILRYFQRVRPIEIRPVEPKGLLKRTPTKKRYYWMQASGSLPQDKISHRAVLAYLSDMTLLDISLSQHGRSVFDPSIQVASLDHSIWFHNSCRADDWLLFVQDSPKASGGRGFCRGEIFSRDGALVASIAQEGLIRERAPT